MLAMLGPVPLGRTSQLSPKSRLRITLPFAPTATGVRPYHQRRDAHELIASAAGPCLPALARVAAAQHGPAHRNQRAPVRIRSDTPRLRLDPVGRVCQLSPASRLSSTVPFVPTAIRCRPSASAVTLNRT